MLFWQRPDLLTEFDSANVDMQAVELARQNRQEKLQRPYHVNQAEKLSVLPTTADISNSISSDLNSDHVTIGRKNDLTEQQHQLIYDAIYALQPWRKGPFSLFGQEIDAEWRSNLKWDRIVPALGDLRSRKNP